MLVFSFIAAQKTVCIFSDWTAVLGFDTVQGLRQSFRGFTPDDHEGKLGRLPKFYVYLCGRSSYIYIYSVCIYTFFHSLLRLFCVAIHSPSSLFFGIPHPPPVSCESARRRLVGNAGDPILEKKFRRAVQNPCWPPSGHRGSPFSASSRRGGHYRRHGGYRFLWI